MYVLSQLKEFWNWLQNKLSDKGLYAASIGNMKLRLQELQVENKQAWKTRVDHLECWDDIDGVLHH